MFAKLRESGAERPCRGCMAIKDAGDTNIGPGQRGNFDHGRFFATANSPVVSQLPGFCTIANDAEGIGAEGCIF